jgi:hypothetical protein
MTSGNHCWLVAISTLAAALTTQSACSSSVDPAAHGKVVLVDRGSQALLASQLLSVNGTYGLGCRERSGDWSEAIAVGAMLDFDELSVVLNDTTCVLTLTELRTMGGGRILATPAITLTASYQATPSSFVVPIEFYANARLSAVSFASDFVLNILYSDDPRLAAADVVATFAVAESTVMAEALPAPNYMLDVTGLSVLTDVNDVVQSVTGSVGLTAGSVTGQRYVVLNESGLILYEDVDAAYLAATNFALTATIPAADFAASLLMVDLTGAPTVRTLIIANTADGVASYQVFAITFHEPA